MKNIKHNHLLLALILLASVAMAQTQDVSTSSSTSENNAVSTARNRYTGTGDASSNAPEERTLAQFRQRGPGAPFPSQRAYPRGTYQNHWRDHGSAGHALIGAAIGFGIGAAIGASKSAHNGTPAGSSVIVGGAILGFIGGAIGSAHGASGFFAHRRRFDLPSRGEEDTEVEAGSRPDATTELDRRSALAKAASSAEHFRRLSEAQGF